jgi:hypothetical protein
MPGNMTSLARLWKRISLSNKILNSRYMVPVSGKKNMMEKYSYPCQIQSIELIMHLTRRELAAQSCMISSC